MNPSNFRGYSDNNLYDGYPPLMSDGRTIIASYQPTSDINKTIIEKNGIQSNWQYRAYLTHNADDLRKQMFIESANDTGYIGHTYAPIHKAPDSDLKKLYLTREELYTKMDPTQPPIKKSGHTLMEPFSTYNR